MPECFCIMSEEIKNRIDPLYYSQDILQEFKKSKFNFIEVGKIVNYLKSGFPAGKEQQSHKPNQFIQIRPTNIDKDNELIFDKNIYLSEKVVNSKTNENLIKEEVLFNNTNSQELVGKTTFFNLDGEYFCSNHITRIGIEENKINPKYLVIVLNIYQKSKVFFNLCTNWNNQSGVNNNLLSSIKIPLPPLEVQNHIVQLMDKAYSSKKQKETEAKQLLDSINDYVLNELGIKLPELKDKMIYVVSSEEVKNNRYDAYYYQPKFEEIEEAVNKGKFEVKPLTEFIIKIRYGASVKNEYVDDGIPLLRILNLKPNKFDLRNVAKLPETMRKDLGNAFVDEGDLLISRSGSVGIVSVVPKEADGFAFGSFMIKFSLNEKVNKYYISAWLNTKLQQLLIERDKIGAIQGNITIGTIEDFKIPLPPLLIQNKIAEEVKQRMQKAEQLQKEAKEELEKAKLEVEKIILD